MQHKAGQKQKTPSRTDGMASTPTTFHPNNWTPSALRVLAVAKTLAVPGKIMPHHLLLGMEVTISVAGAVLRRLRLQPSEVIGFDFPVGYEPDEQFTCADLSP